MEEGRKRECEKEAGREKRKERGEGFICNFSAQRFLKV